MFRQKQIHLYAFEPSGALATRYKGKDHGSECVSTESTRRNENGFMAACKQMLGHFERNGRVFPAHVPIHAFVPVESFEDFVGVLDNVDATGHVLAIDLTGRCGYLLTNEALEFMISKLYVLHAYATTNPHRQKGYLVNSSSQSTASHSIKIALTALCLVRSQRNSQKNSVSRAVQYN